MDECENLPKNMCDSCIIQLNVAYNLKKNAIQSDIKLRQYMIEFGMNVTSYTACSINTVSVIRPPAMLMPTSTTSESVTITTAKSTTVGPPPPPPPVQIQPQPQPPQLQAHRPFPVMPIIIKEEPVDYEAMSDITVETNTEAFEEQMRNHRNRTNGIHSTTSTSTSTSSSSNKSSTPLPVHSMVSVNTKTLLISAKEPTDSEFISAYMLTPSSNIGKTTTTTTTAASAKSPKSGNKRKNVESVSLAEPKSKKTSPPTKSPAKTNLAKTEAPKPSKPLKTTVEKKTKKRPREVDRLFDDSSIQNTTMNKSKGRKTRQQFKELQSVNRFDLAEPHRSRSRNGTPKADYKAFFSSRPSTTPTLNGTPKSKRRQSVDHSTNHVKSYGVKNQNRSLKYSTENRTRRKSVSHNRTRI